MKESALPREGVSLQKRLSQALRKVWNLAFPVPVPIPSGTLIDYVFRISLRKDSGGGHEVE